MDAGNNALADSRASEEKGESDRRSEETRRDETRPDQTMVDVRTMWHTVNSERHLNAIGNRARVGEPTM